MKKQGLFLLALPLLAGLQACNSSEAKNEIPETGTAIPVKLITPESGNARDIVSVSGQFSTNDETFLSFKTGGIIQSILAEEGTYVRKGQLLATLNTTEIKAGVAQAKAAFEKAERDLNRVRNLHTDSVATLEQLQNVQTAFTIAQEQLNAAEFNLSYAEIRAVQDGYILKKFAQPGQLAGPGTPIFQTNGAGSGAWLLKASVSDKIWAKVQLGAKATVSVDALNDTLEGKVTAKAAGADPFNGGFLVEITLLKKPDDMAFGMFGKAQIQTTGAESTWRIPYAAIMDGDGDTGYIFTTSDGNTAVRDTIQIDHITSDAVFVREIDDPEAQIIVSGNAYLTHGSPITPVK